MFLFRFYFRLPLFWWFHFPAGKAGSTSVSFLVVVVVVSHSGGENWKECSYQRSSLRGKGGP